jgi:hypothetical protein
MNTAKYLIDRFFRIFFRCENLRSFCRGEKSRIFFRGENYKFCRCENLRFFAGVEISIQFRYLIYRSVGRIFGYKKSIPHV